MAKNPETGLTEKQAAFVEYYCSNGYNGLQAAKSAEYSGSSNTLGQRAHELVNNSKVRAAIDEYIRKRQEKCEFDREQSELELVHAQERAIAKGDIAAEIAAIREKNTIFALRTEVIKKADVRTPVYTEDELQRLKEQARGLMKPSIKLVKGA